MSILKNPSHNPEAFSAHILAAMIAVGLSLLAHFGFFLFFGGTKIDYLNDASRIREGEHRKIQLDRIERVVLPADAREITDVMRPEATGVEVSGELPDATPGLNDKTLSEIIAPMDENRSSRNEDLNVTPDPPALMPVPSWHPRREMIAIDIPRADDRKALLPRLEIPVVERVTDTLDIIPAFDMHLFRSSSGTFSPAGSPGFPLFGEEGLPMTGEFKPDLITPDINTVTMDRINDSKIATVVPANDRPRALDKLLRATMTAAAIASDPGFVYFMIEVDRISPDSLPVIPKDILFVQDCSLSISEERLYFCRKALKECLKEGMLPSDRFNIIGFAENINYCFDTWQPVSKDSITSAVSFVDQMHSAGETDLYGTMTALSGLALRQGRPTIVILITDGRPTIGTLQSSRIISDFTRRNKGVMSVFTLGTSRSKNKYLLDQLSYCNRGDTVGGEGDRWGIPETFRTLTESVSRPVLSDVNFLFNSSFRGEIYPLQTMNLYEDRPLKLYGRCEAGVTEVTFQATGRAGTNQCDMIFTLPIVPGRFADSLKIRMEWARQKVFALMGLQAVNADFSRKEEMLRTVKEYNVSLPYISAQQRVHKKMEE